MKVHLVDGTYELFRAFYGVPPAHDAQGRPVGALRGLLSTLIALVREPDVTHVACAFDHVIESFRNQLFDGYKTGEGIEPDLVAQFHPAEQAVASLGIVVWPMLEFEADDALATAAARFRDSAGVEQVVICSPDKDFSQCVAGQKVICRDRRRATDRDEAGVAARFGVAGGHIYHVEHALDQLVMRPTLATMRYATPIPGLFLCGSGSHPGGGVTGAPGALGAAAILQHR